MSKQSPCILIVDADARSLKFVEAMLKAEGYQTETATDGQRALALIDDYPPDLILLDIMMPGISGLDVAGKLKRDPATRHIPIVMVTAQSDRTSRIAALNLGAEEFVTKPVERAELAVRVRNLLRLKEYAELEADHARLVEEEVRARTAQVVGSYRETVAALNHAASFRDEETGAHVVRIAHYCRELATSLGMDAEFRDCIFQASPMHDLGKIAIPDRILFKPGPLTFGEWEIMKTHTTLGAKMLDGATSPYLKMARDIALCHHEHWDASGYPHRLKGEQIPLPARMMCLADTYDALRSRRPYKWPFDHAHSVSIITHGDGRTRPENFDPDVLDAFSRNADRWEDIFTTYGSQAEPDPELKKARA